MKQRRCSLWILSLFVVFFSYGQLHAQSANSKDPFAGKSKSVPQLGVNNLDQLIKAMSPEEKASIIIGVGMNNQTTAIVGQSADRVPGAAGATHTLKKYGIPGMVVSDGPAGLRIEPKRANDPNTYYATAFPVGTALSSTWNTDLVKQVGEAMGQEVKEYGVDVLLGPAMNIQRNPLCGRNFEYYSEDPFLAGNIAAAMVNGVQSNGVGTSIKHFAANNQETNRLSIDETISQRAMREIYLRGFEIAIKKSHPWTVMDSYNLIDGTFASERKDMLTDILRDEWGYKGMVMTDWFAGYYGFKQIFNPKACSDVVAQLKAGTDLLMPGTKTQYDRLLKAMKDGVLPESIVDQSVKRILTTVLKTPYYHHYAYTNKPDLKKHAEVTRQAATEGMVLLKDNDQVLPYTNKNSSLAVFGVTSYNFIAGGTGSGDVNEAYTISLTQGLENAGYKLNSDIENAYRPFVKKEADAEAARRQKAGILSAPKRLLEMPIKKGLLNAAAKNSGLAVITIGRNSGEGHDRSIDGDFDLASDEVQMIDEVSKAFHAEGKKVVVILNIGGVIETASWKDKVDGILLAWQAGQEGGNSVADVFSGKANPSGKLPMTFPVQYSDTPSAPYWLGTPKNDPHHVTYGEGIYVGYRYFDTFGVKTSYPFGYGLSYTTFKYSNIHLSNDHFNGHIDVTVDITNTGKVAGKEVAELYLSAPHQMIDKPAEELKAFAKTNLLQPGETETVKLTLTADDLASFVPADNAWIAESGNYKVRIGSSSENILQNASFTLDQNMTVEKVHKAFQTAAPVKELKPKY